MRVKHVWEWERILFWVCQMIFDASQATWCHVTQTICACAHVQPACPPHVYSLLTCLLSTPDRQMFANIQLSEINLYMTDRVQRCNYILLLELFLVLLSILVQLRQWWSALGVARHTQNFSNKELEIILKQWGRWTLLQVVKMYSAVHMQYKVTVHAVTLLGPVWSLYEQWIFKSGYKCLMIVVLPV